MSLCVLLQEYAFLLEPECRGTYSTYIYICYRILYTTNYKLSGHWPGTHTKRQATQHGCLPSLLGNGYKEIEIAHSEEKIFCIGPTRAAKAEQKSL